MKFYLEGWNTELYKVWLYTPPILVSLHVSQTPGVNSSLFTGNLTPPSPSVMHSIDVISGMRFESNSATLVFENCKRYVFF